MKTAVRALVLGMLVTGFAATHMLANQSAATTTNTTMVASSAAPAPMCEPGSGGCGAFK